MKVCLLTCGLFLILVAALGEYLNTFTMAIMLYLVWIIVDLLVEATGNKRR